MDEPKAIVHVENSFKITGLGLVVELEHFEQGLKKGTVLTSEKTGMSWEIKARILFEHAVEEQMIFENESSEYMLLKFDNLDKKNRSIENIRNRESNHVFQYFLKPIEHSTKPTEKEILKIDLPPV